MGLPAKKSNQPPSKRARENYYARKTIDEVIKAQVSRKTDKEVSNDAILRSRFERRLERTLQAVEALPNHQTTECLAQTEQAIRAVLANEQRHSGVIELAENGRSTKAKAAKLEKKPHGGKAVDNLGQTRVEDSVSAVLAVPATPTSYNAPMSPPPAPRKPKRTKVSNIAPATHEAEATALRCIVKEEWTKAGK